MDCIFPKDHIFQRRDVCGGEIVWEKRNVKREIVY